MSISIVGSTLSLSANRGSGKSAAPVTPPAPAAVSGATNRSGSSTWTA